MKILDLETFSRIKEKGLKKLLPQKPRIAVGMGTCGMGNGAGDVFQSLKENLAKRGVNAYLTQTGCFGFCAREPLVNVYLPGKPLVILQKISPKDVAQIISCLAKNTIPQKKVLCKIEFWEHITAQISYGQGFPDLPLWKEVPFFKKQEKIVLRNCGLINPQDIEEYIAVGGYEVLFRVFKEFSPEGIIEEVKKSRLRGRGGAGFPTGRKWELMQQAKSGQKYIICNADEGDPGAYMNRNEMESDPHSLLEGMLIGAYAMGASEGIIYVRAEYPLAVRRIKTAVGDAQRYGLLGENILNSGFNFKINIVEGAGAFVCGEETALIASLEGRAGRPRPRPPFPAEKGFNDKSTNINNVETWFNIPVIMKKDGQWFAQSGSATSSGTKVFSLVGKIKNTGLVELPLGSALKTIVYDIGEGSGNGKEIKAVQTGGPSGGCIPRRLFDTPVDYESLTELGAIMGSGGMVVMDEDNCMVDVAKYFVEFTTAESCGKCVPCREGLSQALKSLKSITEGSGREDDLEELKNLGVVIKDTALCGLGQTAPNPVLTTLRYFKDEYTEHIKEKRCRAGVCNALFLAPCESSCPLQMNIPGFIQLFKEKKIEEAFLSIIQDNPLPAATGRVCQHPCEGRCRRAEIDQPVSKREIHRYIADTIYKEKKDVSVIKRLKEEKFPATGKKIAIIGSGPAGLTAAFYLVRLGHEVTVYEAQKHAGGMLRLTIPDYRLPKLILKHEIDNLKTLGINFVYNTKAGTDISFKKLETMYNAILITVGASEEVALGIPGEKLKGVLLGIQFLEQRGKYQNLLKNKKVVVVGGGNVAIDVARTALRFGAEVTIVYRREKIDMPANAEEIEEAENEEIKFIFLAAPQKIIDAGDGRVKGIALTRMTFDGYDHAGRRKPVATDETFAIECDIVALAIAIGERVDVDAIRAYGINVNKNNTIIADKFTCQTNKEGIYAAGDAVSGPSTVTQAMAAGKKAAAVIDAEFMGEEQRFRRLFAKLYYQTAASIEPQGETRNNALCISREARKGNFKEVCLTFSKSQAEKEILRCLRCDLKDKA